MSTAVKKRFGADVDEIRLGNENQEQELEAAALRASGIYNGPIEGAEMIRADRIIFNPEQPRTQQAKPEEQKAFEENIAEVGIQQPISVGPLVEHPLHGPVHILISGERRLKAARKAGHEYVPAIIVADVVGQYQFFERAIIENAQREDITVADECRAIVRLKDEFHRSFVDIDRLFGKHHRWSNDLYNAWTGGADIQNMIEQAPFSISHANEIRKVNAPHLRRVLIDRVLSKEPEGSFRAIKDAVNEWLAEQARAEQEAQVFEQPEQLPAANSSAPPRQSFKARSGHEVRVTERVSTGEATVTPPKAAPPSKEQQMQAFDEHLGDTWEGEADLTAQIPNDYLREIAGQIAGLEAIVDKALAHPHMTVNAANALITQADNASERLLMVRAKIRKWTKEQEK